MASKSSKVRMFFMIVMIVKYFHFCIHSIITPIKLHFHWHLKSCRKNLGYTYLVFAGLVQHWLFSQCCFHSSSQTLAFQPKFLLALSASFIHHTQFLNTHRVNSSRTDCMCLEYVYRLTACPAVNVTCPRPRVTCVSSAGDGSRAD